jgi:hypothetical protein
MEIRTINQIVDYIEALALDPSLSKSSRSEQCLPTMEP